MLRRGRYGAVANRTVTLAAPQVLACMPRSSAQLTQIVDCVMVCPPVICGEPNSISIMMGGDETDDRDDVNNGHIKL